MLIYISGAISNDPDYKRKFVDAEKALTKKGHDVINPAFVASVLPHLEHEQYLYIDKALIDICDAVYFLKDWGSSKGAREEYEYVRKKNEVVDTSSYDEEKYDFSQERWVHTKRQRKKEKRKLEEKLIKLIFEGENEKEDENG